MKTCFDVTLFGSRPTQAILKSTVQLSKPTTIHSATIESILADCAKL